MDVNEEPLPEPKKGASLAELLHVSHPAVSLYFELATEPTAFPKDEIKENHGLTTKKVNQYLEELQTCGLVRRNPDDTFEAVAPIEAVMIALTRVRNLLRQMRQEFPEKMAHGIPGMSDDAQKKVDELPLQMDRLQTDIDGSMSKVFFELQEKAKGLRGVPTFEAFADNLYAELVEEVDMHMMETRNQLNEFESIEAFTAVLNKLKNDVFDIVNISLSDMREKSFRLHELDTFRETLAELWSITPSVVESHLAEFEQETSTLEASLGDLMETKYRLGAFKGVIENFTRDHIMTSVKKLKENFQTELTESIQNHLKNAQDRFEEVSVAAHRQFESLREQLADWVRNALDLAFNEVIQRNQKATTDLATRLETLTRSIQERFAAGLEVSLDKVKSSAWELDSELTKIPELLEQVRGSEITPKLEKTFTQSEQQLTQLTRGIPTTFNEWRTNYLDTTEKQVSAMLEEAEGHLTVATQGIGLFWQRSKESEPTTFDLYQFVIGEKDFQSIEASLIARARSHLYLILPRATRIKAKLLKMIPSEVRVRIVVADSPESKSVKSIQNVAAKNPNIQLRHDSRGDIWGVIRDFEEILLGNSSKGKANIVGIASSHEDHVDLLRSIMETRWLQAHSISKP